MSEDWSSYGSVDGLRMLSDGSVDLVEDRRSDNFSASFGVSHSRIVWATSFPQLHKWYNSIGQASLLAPRTMLTVQDQPPIRLEIRSSSQQKPQRDAATNDVLNPYRSLVNQAEATIPLLPHLPKCPVDSPSQHICNVSLLWPAVCNCWIKNTGAFSHHHKHKTPPLLSPS